QAARIPGPEADDQGPVGGRGGTVSGGRQVQGQGSRGGGLRRLRRAGTGHRRTGACDGDELVEETHAPVEGGEGRRRSGRGGAGYQAERPARFAGNEAGTSRSMAAGGGEVSCGNR